MVQSNLFGFDCFFLATSKYDHGSEDQYRPRHNNWLIIDKIALSIFEGSELAPVDTRVHLKKWIAESRLLTGNGICYGDFCVSAQHPERQDEGMEHKWLQRPQAGECWETRLTNMITQKPSTVATSALSERMVSTPGSQTKDIDTGATLFYPSIVSKMKEKNNYSIKVLCFIHLPSFL